MINLTEKSTTHDLTMDGNFNMLNRDEILIQFARELASINSTLSAMNEKHVELKSNMEKLSEKLESHHEKLVKMSTATDIFWQKIWPNLGWIAGAASIFFELKRHMGGS